MRRKVSTILDDRLLREAKFEAARQNISFSELFQEALEHYLGERRHQQGGSAVADSWGVLPLDLAQVRALLEEDDGWLDA